MGMYLVSAVLLLRRAVPTAYGALITDAAGTLHFDVRVSRSLSCVCLSVFLLFSLAVVAAICLTSLLLSLFLSRSDVTRREYARVTSSFSLV